MRLTGRDRWLGLALLALLGSGAGAAQEPAAATEPAAGTEPASGTEPAPAMLALLVASGLDPVSYFLPGGPRAGSARFELRRGPRVWRFASEANRTAFARNPEVYAPRFSGYDAAGILDGRLVEADPRAFLVIDERLYLFRDAERRARFLAEPGLAARAETLWPGLGRLTDGRGE